MQNDLRIEVWLSIAHENYCASSFFTFYLLFFLLFRQAGRSGDSFILSIIALIFRSLTCRKSNCLISLPTFFFSSHSSPLAPPFCFLLITIINSWQMSHLFYLPTHFHGLIIAYTVYFYWLYNYLVVVVFIFSSTLQHHLLLRNLGSIEMFLLLSSSKVPYYCMYRYITLLFVQIVRQIWHWTENWASTTISITLPRSFWVDLNIWIIDTIPKSIFRIPSLSHVNESRLVLSSRIVVVV